MEFLRVGAVQGQEVQEVIRDDVTAAINSVSLEIDTGTLDKSLIRQDLPVHVVLGFAFFQEPQCLGQMVVENYCFMPQFANEQILLFNLLLEW